ncbi:DNA-binding transcriptional regulator GbsR (MarR family) [Paenibacillus endophyticus]|uniref:HTH-type transcriptional regulator n=1 Tax=Paenibacillus endophyticus TaxID=1294268 RepID=A0A7W5G8J0_9BACL|nr:transcriptional regulator [Paenibacillus endophyticus]MBB3150671.1 DNA-binding transcriptional regulator GbsR (MarR family) [Paenibacillus endophyticus]
MKRASSPDTGDTPATQEQIRGKIIDAIAQTMDLYGANYSFGQLYGVMFFEDKPMTLEEMKQHMNMSKSNMSYAVRSLMDSKMIMKLDEKQERKDLYVAETDFFQAFQNFFAAKLQREIDVMLGAINEVIPPLSEIILAKETEEEERQLCLKDLHKLRHGIDYYSWLQQFVDGLRSGSFFHKPIEDADDVATS